MTAHADDLSLTADRSAETLEQRLQRLEDAVAALQDTRQIEDRLVERLGQQVRPSPPVPEPERRSEQVSATFPPVSPPPEPALSPSVDMTARVMQAAPTVLRQAWFFTDLYNELRAIFRMFFDMRYRVGWSARLTVLVLVPFFLLSQWLTPFGAVPLLGSLIGPLLDKVVDLLVAFVLFKVLTREAHRYMQWQAARLTGS